MGNVVGLGEGMIDTRATSPAGHAHGGAGQVGAVRTKRRLPCRDARDKESFEPPNHRA